MSAEKILIVDDDVDFADATAAILQSAGYDVISANDGQKGFDLAKTERPDLVILDIMMSYLLEGLSIGARMQADPEIGSTPILMVSAIARTEHLDKFPTDDSIPAQYFLVKPVPAEKLKDTVRWMLAEESSRVGKA